MVLKGKNIILGVCGGIAAYKVCDIIRALVKLGANVECVLTRGGSRFITPLTLQTLSKNRVHQGMFDEPAAWEIEHISLAKKADIVAVIPATADIISRLASGRADNLLTSAVLATKAKVLICPAMNSAMFSHKATQANISALKSYGYKFVMPEKGELACGDTGEGRLALPETVVAEIVKELS